MQLRLVTVLLWLSLSGLTSADEQVDGGKHELLATVDQGIGFGGRFSRGPRVALYRDGTVIFAKRPADNDEAATYFSATLSAKKVEQLVATLKKARQVVDKDLDLAPGWHDLPHVTLSFYVDGKVKSITAYGYAPDGYDGPAAAVPSDKKPDVLPAEFDHAVRSLVEIDPDEPRKWQPELVEIKLSSGLASRPQSVHEWPEKWPRIESKTTIKIDPGHYSVILPGNALAQFVKLHRESYYFRIGDQVWMAYYWEPILPGTERWRSFRDAQDE